MKRVLILVVLFVSLLSCSSLKVRHYYGENFELNSNTKILLYNVFIHSPLLEESTVKLSQQRLILDKLYFLFKSKKMNVIENYKVLEWIKTNNILRDSYPYSEQLKSIIKVTDAELFLVCIFDHSIEGVLEDEHNINAHIKVYNRKMDIGFEMSYSYRGDKSISNTTLLDDIVAELVEKIQKKLKSNQ